MNTIVFKTGALRYDLSDAANNGYLKLLNLDDPWGAYKEWNYNPFTCGSGGGRFHHPNHLGLYAGSGQHCCRIECQGNLSGKVWLPVGPIALNAFDLPRFASDYRYEQLFIHPKAIGGYGPTRYVADCLHEQHNVSGILYQSSQLAQVGSFGLCLALLPYSGQVVQPPFYRPSEGPTALTASGILVPVPNYYP